MATRNITVDDSLVVDATTGAVVGLNNPLSPNSQLIPLSQSSVKSSPFCVFCIPCDEPSNATRFRDVSGNNNHLLVDAANTGAFATPGVASSIAGTAAGCAVAVVGLSSMNFATDSFALFYQSTQATPGSAQTVWSLGASQAASVYSGFYGSLRNGTGILELVQCINSAVLGFTASKQIPVGDSTLRTYALFFDAQKQNAWVYINANLSEDFTYTSGYPAFGHNQAFPNAPLYYAPTVGHSVAFRVGGNVHYTDTTVAFGMQNIHLYRFPNSGLPVNLASMQRKYIDNPRKPILNSDIIFPITTELWCVEGQSNQAGAGAGASGNPDRCINNGDGCPINDPPWPQTTASGAPWGTVAQICGTLKNKWVQFYNNAVGSTSFCEQWVGCVRAYTSNMAFGPGAYIIGTNGSLYKAGGSLGTIFVTSVTPENCIQSDGSCPTGSVTGTTFTEGGTVTGAFQIGQVLTGTGITAATQIIGGASPTWTLSLSSAATGSIAVTGTHIPFTIQSSTRYFEVPGYVYSNTDGTGRYDPNGRIATGLNLLNNAPGYSTKGVYVEFSEGDSTIKVTAAMFKQALVNHAAHVTGLGYRMRIGMSFQNSGNATWLPNLRTGRTNALAALATNSLVDAGADLSQLNWGTAAAPNIGTIPLNETNAQPAATLPTPAFVNNGGSFLHGNATAQVVASIARAAAW